jgi:hypothetical protein
LPPIGPPPKNGSEYKDGLVRGFGGVYIGTIGSGAPIASIASFALITSNGGFLGFPLLPPLTGSVALGSIKGFSDESAPPAPTGPILSIRFFISSGDKFIAPPLPPIDIGPDPVSIGLEGSTFPPLGSVGSTTTSGGRGIPASSGVFLK